MNGRGFVAAACVVLGSGTAWAIDDRVLGRDDVEFADALDDNGYVDLAESLLALARARAVDETTAVYRKVRLDIETAAARAIDDPILRRDALIAVLYRSQRFVDDFRDAPEADKVGDGVAYVCGELGDTIVAAILRTRDATTMESLRTEGDSVLDRAEQWITWRIEPLQARESELDDDEYTRLLYRGFGRAETLYHHALIFQPGSDRRVELCRRALESFDKLDLGWFDETSLTRHYAYLDSGLCCSELGKTNEAVERFDKVIALRQCYGDRDATTGVYPVPPEAGDVVDLVGYAVWSKFRALNQAGRTADAVATAKDYLTTMPRPFDSRSSMLLANSLGNAQLAGGDATGAAETARRMIGEDPDGVGGRWGRELSERCAK